MIVSIQKAPFTRESLLEFLRVTGDLIPDPLSQRVDIAAYLGKLADHGDVRLSVVDGKPAGLIAYYANNLVTRTAYVSWLSVANEYHGKGVGSELLAHMEEDCARKGMRLIHLKVHPRNRRAFLFYRKHGYSVTNLEGGKLVMQRDLPQAEPSFTSQVERSGLLAQAGIDLRIKRDDSFPVYGGGNKARKIVPILRSVKRAGHRAIVTNGSVQSNHARATALACAEAGLPCRVVLHHEGNEPDLSTGNLLLMRLAGAHVEFCRLAELSARMDQAVAEWAIQGLNPFYLWGGGHCVEGTLAYFHAAKEAQAQCGDWIPDYVVHSSGSGTTQAGLTAGYAGGPTKVIGVSISRREERGTRVVQDAIRQLEEHLQVPLPPNAVHFRDDWVMGGYEKISTELLAAIDEAGSRGLILDPTYTGKSWFGLIQMLKNREIKRGSKVLFWHTGGLFNLITSPHYSTRTT